MTNSSTCREPLSGLRLARWIAGGLALLLTANRARAIDPNRTISQYVVQQWSLDQGFSRAPVYSIGQSADGYLVLATPNGLLRFDGLHFQQIHSADVNAVLNRVVGLITDSRGTLWLRLSDAGLTLLQYEHGAFRNLIADLPATSSVDAIARGRDGIAVCLLNDRVGSSLGGRSAPTDFAACGTAPTGGAQYKGLPQSAVLALAQTSDGDFWLGTADEGLFRVHNGQAEAVNEGLPDLKVNALAPAANGELWVGTDSGIVRWDGTKLTRSGLTDSVRRLQVLAILTDRDSNVWLGTKSRGLLRLNAHGVSALARPEIEAPNAVTALFEDREGNLWAGGGGRLIQLRDTPFISYSLPEGLSAAGGSPVFVDSEGRTWFAPVTGGLMWFQGERRGHVSNAGINRDVVYSIAGSGDDLWVGRQRGGLTHLWRQRDSVQSATYTVTDGLAQDSVYSVYQARDGSIWAGTLSGGITHVASGRLTTYTMAHGLISNTVNSIIESSDRVMWFATPDGLSLFSHGSLQSFTTADGLPSNEANCLFVDSSGVLWVGTAAGLAFRTASGFQAPVGASGPLLEPIFGVAEDNFGWLWMATASHVFRVNRVSLLKGALAEGAHQRASSIDVREYGLEDGLRDTEGVKRDRSVVADASGRIWFSVNRAIAVVDPARLGKNAIPPIASMETVWIDGKAGGISDGSHISGKTQRISFDYAGLGLSTPERVRFRYMLEGFDHDWSERVGTRQATYTNLPAAWYRFHVSAANPDGLWSARDATFSFQVDPLFWQTWWFRVSVVMTCIGMMLALHYLRVSRVASQFSMRFEERVRERTRLARDLHDTLLQSFQGLLLRLQAVDDLLPDGKAKDQLEQSLLRADQAIAEGRSAVYDLRSSANTTNDLAQAVRALGEELATPESAAFRLLVEGTTRDLHPIIRDEVYRITREAVRNAFSHAGAEHIETEIAYRDHAFHLRIRDDGKGIPPEVLQEGRSGHYGLRGMHERAAQIGGRLEIWSLPKAGTEIELNVAGSIAYWTSTRPPLFRRFWKERE